MAEVHVGVSGWSYDGWRGDFYPDDLPRRRWLAYVAERLTSVELNGSFYSLQRPTTYQRIADDTPDGFPVAVKGGRFITHLRRLGDVGQGLANFFASGVLLLGDGLGPLLWQLPGDFSFDDERVRSFLERLPRDHHAAARLAGRHDDKVPDDRAVTSSRTGAVIRHALEPRHPSFGEPEAVALLREQGVALVASDSPGAWPCFDEDTADFRYVRLHGHTELYASGYSSRSLDTWARKLRAWREAGQDAYVYFDNDARGRAPHDAVALIERLGQASASVS
ncbi:DUF72 domain-containing protein [Nocardioides coralli]|uniref:DUF72 domain-containing protein n=1 Tax=Nocardioides coralli TaxID=2872154 RepID=UPI001CA3C6F1|nr:DUF72 domain-containing protein [Nocardioides coralli]QZY28972.1 DUF72 domain-containing protein [Nocardioides coralli]